MIHLEYTSSYKIIFIDIIPITTTVITTIPIIILIFCDILISNNTTFI